MNVTLDQLAETLIQPGSYERKRMMLIFMLPVVNHIIERRRLRARTFFVRLRGMTWCKP